MLTLTDMSGGADGSSTGVLGVPGREVRTAKVPSSAATTGSGLVGERTGPRMRGLLLAEGVKDLLPAQKGFIVFILFSRPGCGPCVGVRGALKRRDLPFEVCDISKDAEGRQRLQDLGYSTVPVLLNQETGEHFPGQMLNDHLGAEVAGGDDRAA